jgi:hypothetical protein
MRIAVKEYLIVGVLSLYPLDLLQNLRERKIACSDIDEYLIGFQRLTS